MVTTTGSRDEGDKQQDSKRSEADLEFTIGDTSYEAQVKRWGESRRWEGIIAGWN